MTLSWSVLSCLALFFAACLAIPAYRREPSPWTLGRATLKVTLLLLVPLATFVFSALLAPDSKAGATHGWLDSFHYGKVALLPLVLWAVAALYALEVLGLERSWVSLGLFVGALVSGVCLTFGVFVVPFDQEMSFFLLIPAYTAAWYGARAWGQCRNRRTGLGSYTGALAASLPFWAWSVILSRRHHLSLPEVSDCFVVTAALAGHERVVGPWLEVERNGARRRANGQLVTFWRFETLWSARAPGSHRAFRRLYNRFGPLVAGRVRGRLSADLVYLLLKPAELCAAWLVSGTSAGGPPVRPGP